MPAITPTSVKIPPDLKADLQKSAKRGKVKLHAEILAALREWVTKRQAKEKRA